MDVLQLDWRQLTWSLGGLVVAGLLGLIIDAVLHAIARRVVDRTDNIIDNSLVRHGHRPLRWIFPLLAAFLAMPLLPFPAGIGGPLRHALGLRLIGGLAWLLISLTSVIDDLVRDKYRLDVADNLEACPVHTQITVLRLRDAPTTCHEIKKGPLPAPSKPLAEGDQKRLRGRPCGTLDQSGGQGQSSTLDQWPVPRPTVVGLGSWRLFGPRRPFTI